MSKDRDDRDIEIIPPDPHRRREDAEWIFISFEDRAKAFRELPLYRRVLLSAAWLGGVILLGTVVFLIVASAVLIWIPLLLAAALVTAVIVFLRSKFRR